jgi:hypothetical protein
MLPSFPAKLGLDEAPLPVEPPLALKVVRGRFAISGPRFGAGFAFAVPIGVVDRRPGGGLRPISDPAAARSLLAPPPWSSSPAGVSCARRRRRPFRFANASQEE